MSISLSFHCLSGSLAVEEAAQLLGPADREPELDQHDAVVAQHRLEEGQLLEEGVPLVVGAEAEDLLHHGAVVPRPVEDHDLPAEGRCWT